MKTEVPYLSLRAIQECESQGGEGEGQGVAGERRGGPDAEGDLLAETAVVTDGADEVARAVRVQHDVVWAHRLDRPDGARARAVVVVRLRHFGDVMIPRPVEHCNSKKGRNKNERMHTKPELTEVV